MKVLLQKNKTDDEMIEMVAINKEAPDFLMTVVHIDLFCEDLDIWENLKEYDRVLCEMKFIERIYDE